MRTLLVGTIALAALTGCNPGIPRIWRIALDTAPLTNITDSGCYVNKTLPTTNSTTNSVNFKAQFEWYMWDGDSDKQYLDIGNFSMQLAESPSIVVNALIQGKSSDREFSGQKTQTRRASGANATESRQTQITIKFNDYSNAPTGTMRLDARYACAAGTDPCPVTPPADGANCMAQLNFVGRRIDAQPVTSYQNSGL